jgi:putative endonuclease
MKRYYVYILASDRNGTLYIGMTSNLAVRVMAHKDHTFKGFTDKYNVTKLVYVESYETPMEAIMREWKRSWKKRIIEEMTPNWDDLSEGENVLL